MIIVVTDTAQFNQTFTPIISQNHIKPALIIRIGLDHMGDNGIDVVETKTMDLAVGWVEVDGTNHEGNPIDNILTRVLL